MSEVIKNNETGLYNLQIGNTVFESEVSDRFETDSKEIENVLIASLPLNILIELTEPDQYVGIYLERIFGDVVEITIDEVEGWWDAEYVSHYFYNNLKEEIIRAVDTSRTKLEFHSIDHDGDLFEYSMRFSAATVGVAFQIANEINKSINYTIAKVGEHGGNYMRYLANKVFPIAASNIFSEKDKNTTV